MYSVSEKQFWCDENPTILHPFILPIHKKQQILLSNLKISNFALTVSAHWDAIYYILIGARCEIKKVTSFIYGKATFTYIQQADEKSALRNLFLVFRYIFKKYDIIPRKW